MMQKPISRAEIEASKNGLNEQPAKAPKGSGADPLRVLLITLDNHLAGAIDRASADLAKHNVELTMHAATNWDRQQGSLAATKEAIKTADILIVNMMFLEDQIAKIRDDLLARRDDCMALVATMSAGDIINLTKMGKLEIGGESKGAMGLLKRLRGSKKKQASGAGQLAVLRRLPKLLRFIPGTSQDLRLYFLTMLYWLSSSDKNLMNMVLMLVNRYADGKFAKMKGSFKIEDPEYFPEVGIYHPDLKHRFTEDLKELPTPKNCKGTVGLLLMRSYLLGKDTAHYDAVIRGLEAKGLKVIPTFASGLDSRDAINAFFKFDKGTHIDAFVSLTGFSLVGGPAYNDSSSAIEALKDLDVPYIAAHALEFQSLDAWQESKEGLMPIEATLMVAIPELDGATGPTVFGGRPDDMNGNPVMQPCEERVDMLVNRIARIVANRRTPVADRKVAIVLFEFPQGSGGVGSAAFLSVYRSLYNLLERMKAEGYTVTLPQGAEDLKTRMIEGNTAQYGSAANVAATVSADDFIQSEPYLEEIEAQWGPTPGRVLSLGKDILIQGVTLGNVFIGIQPGVGIEGDPMKLLFDKGFAPTHAYSAFYRYIRDTFGADMALHFGTHGSLEFMPGAQVGMSGSCWPDRLIGDLPHTYLYAANNPSEGALAKRRSAATLVSYLTPSVTEAGLYAGIADLKDAVNRYRSGEVTGQQLDGLLELIIEQAHGLDLKVDTDLEGDALVTDLQHKLAGFEDALIPYGLHVLGEVMNRDEKRDLLTIIAEEGHELEKAHAADLAERVVHKKGPASRKDKESYQALTDIAEKLDADGEITGVLKAIEGRFIEPVTGGDLLKTTEILPTGRNIHGFDPFRMPSRFALKEGVQQAELLLETYQRQGTQMPSSIAFVLWGTDTIKTEGVPIGQVLGLVGAKPRYDSYGRLTGAELIPLAELGRPRVDVVMTVSGIFRDLLPLQMKMLAEAMKLATLADEPLDQNPIRAHSMAYAKAKDTPLEEAALRVFSNAEGVYGSNVNLLLDSGRWNEEDELADTFTARKCFAYGADGGAAAQGDLMNEMLADVDMTYQNLESVELGVTTIDQYFDTLGGISRAVRQARGKDVPVYIGDQTHGSAKVRTLDEQVEMEARTRMLNPKWIEGMLEHGYEGVRQIEAGVTNTLGWSATTGQVAPWIYQRLTESYVLDEAMRQRLAELNPQASVKMTNRLLEAHERNYWEPDEEILEELRRAGEELEDRLEGISEGAAA